MIRCDPDQHSELERRNERAPNIWRPAQTRHPHSIRETTDHPDAKQEDWTVRRDNVRSSFCPSALKSSPSLRCSSDNDLPASPDDKPLGRSPLSTTGTHMKGNNNSVT